MTLTHDDEATIEKGWRTVDGKPVDEKKVLILLHEMLVAAYDRINALTMRVDDLLEISLEVVQQKNRMYKMQMEISALQIELDEMKRADDETVAN